MMLYSVLVKKITVRVKTACRNKNNIFGPEVWKNHILPVVASAKLLAQKLGADEEIIELSALLHDYASILDKNLVKNHEIHSAALAEKLLLQYDYPKERIELIKHCILAHRGSKPVKQEILEAKIVASADALSHFNNIASLMHLAYKIHGLDIEKGRKWVLAKLERSWNKLMPQAKQMIRHKHRAIQILFNKDI